MVAKVVVGGQRSSIDDKVPSFCGGSSLRYVSSSTILRFAGVLVLGQGEHLAWWLPMLTHDNACGCHFLLGGMVLGLTTPSPQHGGNPRYGLPDRATVVPQRHPFL
jgi:hypothetical protein